MKAAPLFLSNAKLPTLQMPDDTAIGGTADRFPQTRWSAIVAVRSDNATDRARGLEAIAASYWKPVYKYIRLRWNRSSEDAKDLTQEFFSRLIEKGFLNGYDPAKARLRTFLRVCIDGLVQNEDKSARRLKRGGDAQILSLDFESAEGELARLDPPAPGSLGDFFEQEWVRSLFGLAVDALRADCKSRGKSVHFRLFELYDLNDDSASHLTYDDLARQFDLAPTDVTNYLAFARREFRRIALEKLREMTASDDEFRREARSLFGFDPGAPA